MVAHIVGYARLLSMVGLAIGSAAALAQGFPEKPVRLVVPFPPGGGSDILARAIAPKTAEALGQPLVIDNRPGAGGNIGAEAVAKAAPDGYILLFGANTIAINAFLYPNLPFDSAKAFAPVGLVASAPMLLVVHPAIAANNVRELVAEAKANPAKINFSTPGSGTPQHVAAELFNRMAGVSITHIMYKGGGPALTDLIAGQTQVAMLTMASVKPYVSSGKLKAIAVATASRSQSMPDVPTIAESGVPGYEADLWYGIFAPSGTPAETIRTLNAALGKALADREVGERLSAQGFEVKAGPPDRLGSVLRADFNRYGKLIREANIRAE